MRIAGRFGLIVACFVLLSAPVGAVCEALENWMANCHASTPHEMPGCSDKSSVAPNCCDSSTLAAETDLVLKRPDDGDIPLGAADLETVHDDGRLARLGRLRPAGEPPPRPPGYALLSSLLL